jgi:hypothetical protein
MKCNRLSCIEEAKIFLIDKVKAPTPYKYKPGAIIECDDPTTLLAYCDFCWSILTAPFSNSRWSEGSEL